MQSKAVSRLTYRLAAVSVGTAVAVAGATGVAHANAAYKYVKPYRDYTLKAPDRNDVQLILSSSQPAPDPLNPMGDKSGVVSYSEGLLGLAPKTSLATLQPLKQLFSDRRYSGTSAPFDPSQADSTGVKIGVNDSTQTVTIKLTLFSSGNTVETLSDPRVEDGMLVADGPGAGQNGTSALFTVALDEVSAPG